VFHRGAVDVGSRKIEACLEMPRRRPVIFDREAAGQVPPAFIVSLVVDRRALPVVHHKIVRRSNLSEDEKTALQDPDTGALLELRRRSKI
jgi:hypothetical protein